MNGTQTGAGQCPICKSAVSATTVVPVYGRGRDRRPADADGGGAPPVPSRPAGTRTEPPAYDGGGGAGGGGGGGAFGGPGGIAFSAGFGFFPSLFTLQFTTGLGPGAGGGGHGGGARRPAGPDDAHQAFLERVMLAVGLVILFFLLFM